MKDKIYRSDNERIKPFEFNDEVTSVFSDMINRSVPGYELITSMMPVIAEKYAQSNSSIYDLGCSLGAVSFAIRNKIIDSEIKITAIDSSKSMINSCKKNIEKKKVELPIEFIIDDILNINVKEKRAANIPNEFMFNIVSKKRGKSEGDAEKAERDRIAAEAARAAALNRRRRRRRFFGGEECSDDVKY